MLALTYRIKPFGWLACKCLHPVWRTCRVSSLSGLKLEETGVPELPGENWVTIRTRLAGVCGTDVAIVSQKQRPGSILQAFSSMPCVLGHENVGVVESVGQEVSPDWVGKRVCVDPALCCEVRGIDPPCRPCAAGQFGACENFADDGGGTSQLPPGTSIGYNSRTGGAFGELFVAHASQLHAVPESVSDEIAVLTDPVACALHAALRADLSAAKRVLIYGTGTLGLSLIACLRAIGFKGHIDALGRRDAQAVRAGAMGVDEFFRLPQRTGKRFESVAARTDATVQRTLLGSYMLSGGYDVVFDCVTSARSVTESLKWTAARGQMVFVGTGDAVGADLTSVWFRELTMIGAYGRQAETLDGRTAHTYDLVLEMIAAGTLDVESLLTHTFELADYRRVFMMAMNKSKHDAIKIAFDFREKERA